MGYLQSRILPARVSIIRQGEEPEAAYFVVSGQVERLAGSVSQTLSVGDMFGAAAVLGDDVSSVTYRTLTRCRLLVLDRADYLEIDHRWPDFAEKLRDLGVASRKDRMRL
jgi:voltage-gated potassium channel